MKSELGGLPFNTLESDLFRDAFRLLNVTYTPPSRNAIRNRLLPEIYTEYRREKETRETIDETEEERLEELMFSRMLHAFEAD